MDSILSKNIVQMNCCILVHVKVDIFHSVDSHGKYWIYTEKVMFYKL